MTRSAPNTLDVTVAEQRRAQVVRAVMASIAEEGLERTTMRNVAERAGLSTGAIAYYFANKQEMIEAALLVTAQEVMDGFERDLAEGRAPHTLDEIIDQFLAPENTAAGFVLEMIALGLHNPRLRTVHERIINTGQGGIEDAIRRGIESGRYRSDIDPTLSAAMFHGMLIWWGSELMANATSQEFAREVARCALRLLESAPVSQTSEPSPDQIAPPPPTSTPERIRAILEQDANLTTSAAQALSDSFEKLYGAMQSGAEPRTIHSSGA